MPPNSDPAPAVAVASLRAGHPLAAIADAVSRAIDTVLAYGMIASILLNCANVLGRYVFGFAIVGADELLVYGMVATIFLGAVSVTWRDAHLRLDVLLEAASPRRRRLARSAAELAILVLCLTVGIGSAGVAVEMAHFDQRSLAAGLPMVLPHGAVALGLWLMALMAALRLAGCRPGAGRR